jgi:hypothetical protein
VQNDNDEILENDMRSKKSSSSLIRLIVGILVLFFAATLVASSQELKTLQLPDTSVNWQQRVYSESLFPRFSFLPPRPLGLLYQEPLVPSRLFFPLQEKIDLASPWKLELANQEKYRTMWTILGSIEAGGVAYIAYQHIKKYGLK